MIRSRKFYIMTVAVKKGVSVMKRVRVLCFLAMVSGVIGISNSTINAETINLRGKVSNSTGQPVANAVVTLVSLGLKDTSTVDGSYSIIGTPVILPIKSLSQSRKIVLENGSLKFSLSEPSPVKVELYSIEGKLLKKEALQNASAGSYSFNIGKKFHTNLLIVKISIGKEDFTIRYVPSNGRYLMNQSIEKSASAGGKLAKTTAVSDTLSVSAKGFTTKKVPISSYDQQLNVTLDSSSIQGNVLLTEGFEEASLVDSGFRQQSFGAGDGMMSISKSAAHSGQSSLTSDSNRTSIVKWFEDPINDSIAGIEFYLLAKKAEHINFYVAMGRQGGSFGMLPNGFNCFMGMGIDKSDSLWCIHGQYDTQISNPVYNQKRSALFEFNKWQRCNIEYDFAKSSVSYYLNGAEICKMDVPKPARLDVFAAVRDSTGAQGQKDYYVDDITIYKK